MKKLILVVLSFFMVYTISTIGVHASSGYLSVKILSPSGVEAYPGYKTTVKAQITNNSNDTVNNLVAYITMVDLTKNMTVNLEDYNADVPVTIPTLNGHESITIDLPIVLVYPDVFHLYVSVASLDTKTIISSDSITSHILTQSNINPTYVMVASISIPIIVFFSFLGVQLGRNKQLKKLSKQPDELN